MELVGFETQFVVVKEVGVALREFTILFRDEWPELVLSVGWTGDDWEGTWDGSLAPDGDVIFLARDMEMVRHFETFSFNPMDDGAGVVGVSFYRIGDAERLLVSVPENQRMRAYEAELVAPSYACALELTTPRDPATGGFSQMARNLLVRTFRA